jgi:hypothetical protein
MTDAIFAERLRSLAPTRDFFRQKRLPDDFTEDFLDGYNCKDRDCRKKGVYFANELLNLISNYDCSKVSIGIIDFLPEIIERPDHYYFGNAEQDIIVVDKVTLGVNVVDPAEPSHIIWKCASNGELFLEALLLCAEFFTARVKDYSLLSNDDYTLKIANECGEIAGGEEYTRFYKMLFGYSG